MNDAFLLNYFFHILTGFILLPIERIQSIYVKKLDTQSPSDETTPRASFDGTLHSLQELSEAELSVGHIQAPELPFSTIGPFICNGRRSSFAVSAVSTEESGSSNSLSHTVFITGTVMDPVLPVLSVAGGSS